MVTLSLKNRQTNKQTNKQTKQKTALGGYVYLENSENSRTNGNQPKEDKTAVLMQPVRVRCII